MGVFEVADFELILKFKVAPFLVSLSTFLARNLCNTRDWQVVRVQRRLHRVSRRILHKDLALFQKLWKGSNLLECPCLTTPLL